MKSDFFTDNDDRVARKLLTAEEVRLRGAPACYLIQNTETEHFYVGSTKNISKRLNSHAQMLKNNNHSNQKLQEEYNKCRNKDNLIVHISYTETTDNARDREQEILDEGHGTEVLLNKSNNARIPSSGYDRNDAYTKSRTYSNLTDTKERVSKESKERWRDPVLRRKMITAMGENIKIDGVDYGSVREASRETGVSIAAIRKRLVNGECSLSDIKPISKTVVCEGKEYKTVTEASEAYGIKPNTMTYRLNSTSNTWKEFNYKN